MSIHFIRKKIHVHKHTSKSIPLNSMFLPTLDSSGETTDNSCPVVIIPWDKAFFTFHKQQC